jgi:uncharacterized membrane protein HdeD (DUF308 family)
MLSLRHYLILFIRYLRILITLEVIKMNGICAKRPWYILEGLCMGLLGILILVLAGIFPAMAQFYYGLLFLIAGCVLGLRSLGTLKVAGDFFSIIEAIVLIVAGIILLTASLYAPAAFMWYLTIVLWILAVLFFIESMFRVATTNWGFLFINSLAFAIIGFVLIIQPLTVSSWSLSIMVGVAFMIYALCQLLTAVTAQNKRSEPLEESNNINV